MRTTVRFLLGQEPRELAAVDPTMTVLDWLRTVERRTGTKEGCNEGDCGACTVVLARPAADGLSYRAVNACIQLVATLDGCQLLTVEDLKAPDGTLHAAQRAMVEEHGSQCGFCTPGFVMSITACLEKDPKADLATIQKACSGNVCRCGTYPHVFAAALETAQKAKKG